MDIVLQWTIEKQLRFIRKVLNTDVTKQSEEMLHCRMMRKTQRFVCTVKSRFLTFAMPFISYLSWGDSRTEREKALALAWKDLKYPFKIILSHYSHLNGTNQAKLIIFAGDRFTS